MSDPITNQAERNQIDVLIGHKKDEIEKLEALKETFNDDHVAESTQTPAQVAQDETASSAARAAAATQATTTDPVTINAEQQQPSPSTHSEQFETETPKVEEPVAEVDDKPAAKKASTKKS